MKKNLLSVLIAIVSVSATAQIVNIPDAGFKAYLLKIHQLDKDKDGEIQVSEASAYSRTISYKNYANQGVDLTGLEAFTAITKLEVNANGLSSLDVSKNTELTTLICFKNSIKTLDLSKNTKLTSIHCYYNSINDLKIGSLDVLTSLRCYNNGLTSLDLSGATKLTELLCHTNQLTSLKTTGATALAKIISYTNKNLKSLDLSTNSSLTNLWTYNCDLQYLNVANGNNTKMAGWQFNTETNANLTCIQVDDVAYSDSTWTKIDLVAKFSLKCNPVTSSIYETSSSMLNVFPNPSNGKVFIEGMSSLTNVYVFNALGQMVMNIDNPKQSIDMGQLNNGMYVLLVNSENGLSTHKIQITH